MAREVIDIRTGKRALVHGRRGAIVDGTALTQCMGELIDGARTAGTVDRRRITCPECRRMLHMPALEREAQER